jgi:L-aminopeptidase/D-esterase-like protein
MLKLSFSFDFVRFILLNNELNRLETVIFCVIFQFLTMFNTIVGAGTVGAGDGATSCYGFGSGSGQMMRLCGSGSATLLETAMIKENFTVMVTVTLNYLY